MLHKTPLLFLLKVAALFYCFYFLKPLQSVYVATVRTASDAVFEEVGEQGRIKFEPWTAEEGKATPWNEEDSARMDTQVSISNQAIRNAAGQVATLKFPISLAYIGFIPTIFLAALMLSSPIPWPSRLKGLGLGTLLLQGAILISVWVSIYYTLLQNPGFGLVSPESWKATAVTTVWQLAIYGKITLAVSVLIWIAVMLRKNRLKAFLPSAGERENSSD